MTNPYPNADNSKLEKIRKNIQDGWKTGEDNRASYREWMRFNFISTLTDDQKKTLIGNGKPPIMMNVCEAIINKALGKFSKQIPGIQVISNGTNNPKLIQQQEIIEGYMRAVNETMDSKEAMVAILRDMLGGGYGVAQVFTEYENERSFNQLIKFKRVDPTEVGFSPGCKKKDKSDSPYAFYAVEVGENEFKKQYPNVEISNSNWFGSVDASFKWYRTESMNERFVKIVNYWEVEKKPFKLVEVVITPAIYNKLNPMQPIDPRQPPQPIVIPVTAFNKIIKQLKILDPEGLIPLPERKRTRTAHKKVVRFYKIMGNEILEEQTTDFKSLPFVFFDCNSVTLDGKQKTRPFDYQAGDAQRMLDLAMSSYVKEIENMRSTDVVIPRAAIPEGQAREGWLHPERASAALQWEHLDKDGNPIPAPVIQNRGILSSGLFQLIQEMERRIQIVMGQYSSGVNNIRDISGESILQGAFQNDEAWLPYIQNFIHSFNQVKRIELELIPKYYNTARTIPVLDENGKPSFKQIGQPDQSGQSLMLDYGENELDVIVKPGVNFEMAKNQALIQIEGMAKALPAAGEFFNTKALPIVMENLSVHGQDRLRNMAVEWQKEKQEAPKKPDPAMLLAQAEQKKAQAAEQGAQTKLMQAQMDAQNQKHNQHMDMAKLQMEKAKQMNDLMKIKADIILRMQKMEDERDKTAADIELKTIDRLYKKLKDDQDALERQAERAT
jgi:hypothetical protein